MPGEGGALRPARRAGVGFYDDDGELRYAGQVGAASPRPSSSACRRLLDAARARGQPVHRRASRRRRRASSSPSWSRASSTATSRRAARCAIRSTRACATTSTRRDASPEDAESPTRRKLRAAASIRPASECESCRDQCGVERSPSGSSTSRSSSTPPCPRRPCASTSSTARPATGSRRSASDSVTGEEVAYENLVKGYELTQGQLRA